MTFLYGSAQSRLSLSKRAGSIAQFGSVRLSTLEDGPGRGVRILDFNTGGGLRFTVNVDRAMDIGEFSHNGRAIGWHSATGTRHPAFNDQSEDNGVGWNRSFSGFLATCGLDHILGPEDVSGETYNHASQLRVKQGLHGRIANTPARLSGYGEFWHGDTCSLWAEGIVTQATLFGEVLTLHRRLEVDLGSNTVRVNDSVTNDGPVSTPHMLLYHVNLGYPLIDSGTQYTAPVKSVIYATHAKGGLAAQGVGYRTCPDPITGFTEQVWQHDMAHDAMGMVPVVVANHRQSLGLMMETHAPQLPCAYQWQNFQSGHYVMGVEAATHHVKGNNFARDRGEMIWLESGECRNYSVQFSVLDGEEQISNAENRVSTIAQQPDSDYPEPTNKFLSLYQATEI
jgi:hypothetical protein